MSFDPRLDRVRKDEILNYQYQGRGITLSVESFDGDTLVPKHKDTKTAAENVRNAAFSALNFLSDCLASFLNLCSSFGELLKSKMANRNVVVEPANSRTPSICTSARFLCARYG